MNHLKQKPRIVLETKTVFRTRKTRNGLVRYPIEQKVIRVYTSCGLEFSYTVKHEETIEC